MTNRASPRARSAELRAAEAGDSAGAVLEPATATGRFAPGAPPGAAGSVGGPIHAVRGASAGARSGTVCCDIRAAGAAFAAPESGAPRDGTKIAATAGGCSSGSTPAVANFSVAADRPTDRTVSVVGFPAFG